MPFILSRMNNIIMKSCIVTKILILSMAMASLFCSVNKRESEPTKIVYLWRYDGFKAVGLKYSPMNNMLAKESGLMVTLNEPYEVFKKAYKEHPRGNQDGIKDWFAKNINNFICEKITIKEYNDFLNKKYENNLELNTFEEKIQQLIKDKIIKEETQRIKNDANSNNVTNLRGIAHSNHFFKEINSQNIEKYILFAYSLIIDKYVESIYFTNNHNDLNETQVKLIFDKSAIDTLINIKNNTIEKLKNNRNIDTNPITILKVDLNFIAYNYFLFYNFLIDTWDDKFIVGKFTTQHKDLIKDYFECFAAQYIEIVKRCIIKNENNIIIFPIMYTNLETFMEATTKYHPIYGNDENHKSFFKNTLIYLKSFYRNIEDMVNVTTRLKPYIDHMNTSLDGSIQKLHDNNFRFFVQAYKESKMKEFLDLTTNEIKDEKFYFNFLKNKTIFLDEIMNHIALIFIKKQIGIILKNQKKSKDEIVDLVKKERNRISKNKFIKTALERSRTFKKIQEKEIMQFKANMEINQDVYAQVSKKLKFLKTESAIINDLINLKLREILFTKDINNIESFINNELQYLCEGINQYFKSLDEEKLRLILSYASNKTIRNDIFTWIDQNTRKNEKKNESLEENECEDKAITGVKNAISIKKTNEKRINNVLKQINMRIMIIEYQNAMIKKAATMHNASIRNLIYILIKILENIKKDIQGETEEKEYLGFDKLEGKISIITDLNTLFVDCDILSSLVNSQILHEFLDIPESVKKSFEAENPDTSVIDLSKNATNTNEVFIAENTEDSGFKELSNVIEYFYQKECSAIPCLISKLSDIIKYYDEIVEILTKINALKINKQDEKNIMVDMKIEIENIQRKVLMKDLLSEFEFKNILHTLIGTNVEDMFEKSRKDSGFISSSLICPFIKDIINEVDKIMDYEIDDPKLIGHLLILIKLKIENKNMVLNDNEIIVNSKLSENTDKERITKLKDIIDNQVSPLIDKNEKYKPIYNCSNLSNVIDETIKNIPDMIKVNGKGHKKIIKKALSNLKKNGLNHQSIKHFTATFSKMNDELMTMIKSRIISKVDTKSKKKK